MGNHGNPRSSPGWRFRSLGNIEVNGGFSTEVCSGSWITEGPEDTAESKMALFEADIHRTG